MTAGRRRGRDAGESLVEILLSVMIIGIAVTAILGGVGLAARASSQDERQIQAQALLRSWAEHVQARTTDSTYVACATTATYSGSTWAYTSPAPAGLEPLPAGFTASVTEVQYWDPSTTSFGSTCGTDSGVQRVRLALTATATAAPGFTSTYDVVVRRPCAALAASGGPGC
ncbi:type IV pilus modification PilV family protein [Cellulomonas endophytica]|uniref:type IV pilus modification PilV family protein n=1 Tax=Cellulomonas endophytica TaxID=2494735 RepID=UPI001011A641|nr:type II secretion system protein [Cellulomonas endophytica]